MCWMKRSNTLITQVLLFEPCKFHHSVLNDRVTFYQDYLHSAIACRNEPSRWQFAVFKKDSKIQRKANKTSWTRPTKSQSRETQSESSNLSVLATTKAATAGPRFCCRPRSSLNAATPSYHIPKNKTKNIHQTCFLEIATYDSIVSTPRCLNYVSLVQLWTAIDFRETRKRTNLFRFYFEHITFQTLSGARVKIRTCTLWSKPPEESDPAALTCKSCGPL